MATVVMGGSAEVQWWGWGGGMVNSGVGLCLGGGAEMGRWLFSEKK